MKRCLFSRHPRFSRGGTTTTPLSLCRFLSTFQTDSHYSKQRYAMVATANIRNSLTRPQVQRHAFSSSQAKTTIPPPRPPPSVSSPDLSLRNMIKPFLLKCHPDVQQADLARKVNLTAIQHLNSYLDTIQTILSTDKKPTREPSSRIFEIDFIMTVAESGGMKKGKKLDANTANAVVTSRRKVELILPPVELCRRVQSSSTESQMQVKRHAAMQLVRLLKMAGLDHPLQADLEEEYERQEQQQEQDGRRPFRGYNFDNEFLAYIRRRDRLTASINWKRVDELYDRAVADMEADFATEGLIANHAGRRRSMIASVLAKVRFQNNDNKQEETSMLEQLIAIRRLSLLLDENFSKLKMEEFGRLWENCILVLGPARPYNISSSALHKRRLQMLDTGYSFTLHPDFSFTIEIPIDFRDDELVLELQRNIWDIYDLRESNDGFESIFTGYSV